ncbi:MAG: ABC transporter permease [Rhizobiales bacterium]|nr:ABC transporter permease [Hyphomicrobiales bacterium]
MTPTLGQRLRHIAASPVFLLLILLAAGLAIEPVMTGERAIRNILISATPLILAGIAQALVILVGGIDLSIGAIISVTNVVAVSLMTAEPGMVVPIVAAVLLLGLAIGLVNGLLCAYSGASPFIITLAMGIALQGVALEIMYQPSGTVAAGFREIARLYLGALPVATLVVIAFAILLAVAIRRTSWGVSLIAIGGNETSARLSGIAAQRHKVALYAISGLLAAVAGLFLASRIGTGDPLVGDPVTLDSITVAVLGGGPFFGGSISIVGTTLAGIVLAMINTLLNLQGVSPFYQWILKGAILIAALSLDLLRRRKG